MEWTKILLPSIVTGALAGVSEFIAKQQLGYKTALIAAGIAFLIMFLQELKDKLDKNTQIKNTKKKLQLFLFQK